jgi:hypothetical protein
MRRIKELKYLIEEEIKWFAYLFLVPDSCYVQVSYRRNSQDFCLAEVKN